MRQREAVGGAPYRSLLIGIPAALAAGAAFLLLFALLMTLWDLPPAAVTAFAVAAAVGGAFVGGFFTARLSGEKGWLMGLLCGAALFLLLFVVGICIHRELRAGMWLLKLFLLLAGGMAGGMLGVNKK